MKEKILGVICVVSSLGWGIFFAYFLIDNMINNQDNVDFSEISFMVSGIIAPVSMLLYVINTLFWKLKNTEISNIDYEIRLMKKQIENHELKTKLDISHYQNEN